MVEYGAPTETSRRSRRISIFVPVVALLGVAFGAILLLKSQSSSKSEKQAASKDGAELIALRCDLSGSEESFSLGSGKVPVQRSDVFIVDPRSERLYGQDYREVKARFTSENIFPGAGESVSQVNPVDGRGFNLDEAYKINRKTLGAEYMSMSTQNLSSGPPTKTYVSLAGICRKIPLPPKPSDQSSGNQV
jgi:hypothetical protein